MGIPKYYKGIVVEHVSSKLTRPKPNADFAAKWRRLLDALQCGIEIIAGIGRVPEQAGWMKRT